MEIDELRSVIETELQAILRAITVVSEQVKDLDGRVRAIEISSASAMTGMQTQIGQIQQRQESFERVLEKLDANTEQYQTYIKAMQTEVITYVKELLDDYVKDDDFAGWKVEKAEKEAERWLEQEKLNTTFRNARTFFLMAAGTVITILLYFIYEIVIAGGIANFAASSGLIP